MNTAIERRLAALEAAVKEHTVECCCDGNGRRFLFNDRIDEPNLPTVCQLHGPVEVLVFDDPTQRPPGYDRKGTGAL